MFNKFNDSEDFFVMRHNMQSLTEIFENLKLILDSLNVLSHIICLTEIWLSEFELPCFTMSGYNEASRAGEQLFFCFATITCSAVLKEDCYLQTRLQ